MNKVDLKLVVALARARNNIFVKIEKSVQKYGLNISEFGVLEYLFHKGAQPVQLVAEKILVTSGTITYVIDKLIKKGLVTRVRSEDDKRVYFIELTSEGSQLISRIFPEHEAYLASLFGDVKAEDKEVLVRLLFELNDMLD
jgi:MarR family 2-MHQ and catechol resistance regulon transcriptional repressor